MQLKPLMGLRIRSTLSETLKVATQRQLDWGLRFNRESKRLVDCNQLFTSLNSSSVTGKIFSPTPILFRQVNFPLV